MNWINAEKKAEQFFKKWLKPRSRNYFPTGFDEKLPSYFIRRKDCRMTAKAFELGSQMSAECLADCLSHFWSARQENELEPLAKPLAELAQSVYSIDNQNEELSPFIYVMY